MKTFFEDAGHGWLGVKRAELQQLGILDKITHYSYQRGNMVYLEEDCDLSTYHDAIVASGQSWEELRATFKRSYSARSPVRSYEHFKQIQPLGITYDGSRIYALADGTLSAG